MSQTIIYHHDNPSRIDKFLADYLSISRNLLHRIFDDGEVLVWDKKVKKSFILNNGDKIYCDVDIKRFDAVDIFPESTYISLDILHEHDDYIVLYKPKWISSHPKSLWDVNAPSVASFLYHKYGKLEEVWPFVRAGIVHRLDKDTDGLMICVLSERWLKYFRALFDARSSMDDVPLHQHDNTSDSNLQKYYKALCDINPIWSSKLRTMSLPYFINKIVIPKIPQKTKIHKMWVTEIVWYNYDFDKKKFDGYGLSKLVELDLKIWTGRTHQIRYHLSTIWLPIVWDYLYNPMYKKIQQLQLTAYRLKFIDPDGLRIDISI